MIPCITRHGDDLIVVVCALISDLHRLRAKRAGARLHACTSVLVLGGSFVGAGCPVITGSPHQSREISFGLDVEAANAGAAYGDRVGCGRMRADRRGRSTNQLRRWLLPCVSRHGDGMKCSGATPVSDLHALSAECPGPCGYPRALVC